MKDIKYRVKKRKHVKPQAITTRQEVSTRLRPQVVRILLRHTSTSVRLSISILSDLLRNSPTSADCTVVESQFLLELVDTEHRSSVFRHRSPQGRS
jgi:hypothetical protein